MSESKEGAKSNTKMQIEFEILSNASVSAFTTKRGKQVP